MLEMALVENIQRSDLNALEVALSYQRLIDECSLQHDELAKRVGKDRSTVTNYTRLLKLPPDLQAGLRNKKISMGHARALLSLSEPVDQLYFYNKILNESLSVRNTEALIRKHKTGEQASSSGSGSSRIHPEVRKIRDRLSRQLGVKVDIKFNDIIDNIED